MTEGKLINQRLKNDQSNFIENIMQLLVYEIKGGATPPLLFSSWGG